MPSALPFDPPRPRLLAALLAVLAAMVLCALAPAPSAASAACGATGSETVRTDRPSYPNRDLVHVTGSGYAPDCDVAVRIVRPDGSVVTGDGSETPGSDMVRTGADGALAYGYRLGTVDGTYWVYVVDPDTNAILAMVTFEDAASVTSLNLNATGAENYVFTAGDQVDAAGAVSNSKHYRWTVIRSDGTQRVGPCNATSGLTSGGSEAEADSYVVGAADPASTATLYTYQLQEFANNDATCSSPNSTASLQFAVVKASSYADSALSVPRTAFGAGATAYLKLDGLTPSQADWTTTWVLPTGATACANTLGADRADSSSAGRLPDVAASFLQYQPGASGAAWNLSSSYDGSCPPLTGNDGTWRLRLQRDATHFVDLPAFTAATVPPDTSITAGPSGTTTNPSPSFSFTSDKSPVTFECKLDGPGAATGSYASCTSAKSYASLAEGDYTFSVRAIDAAANVDSTPATRSFTVDTTAPAVTVTQPAASSFTADTTPPLAGVAGNSAGDSSTVTAKVYAGAAASGSPVRTFAVTRAGTAWSVVDADWSSGVPLRAPLTEGQYTVQAEQSDGGSTGVSNTRTFRVDTTPPSTTDNVPAPVQATNITVTLTANDAGAGVEKTYYTTDDSDPADPGNPSRQLYSAGNKPVLRDGEQVRYYSVDLVGNVEPVHVSGVAKVDAGSSLVGVDGNQDGGSGSSLTGPASGDWQGEWSSGLVTTMNDRNDLDLGFGGGTKETDPYFWTLINTAGGVTPAKSNIQAAWTALESTRSTSFLYLAFKREGTTGNTFLSFELNQQAATYVDAAGTTIPCRKTGDLLVSFETGNPPSVHVYKWVSTTAGPPACPEGAIGTFVSAGELSPSQFQARMNGGGAIANYLASGKYGTTFPANSFGEAALDLPSINAALNGSPCSSFVQVQVHSRSSESLTSQLQDYVTPSPVNIQSCSASGGKFEDRNANGVRDAGEPGIPGFKLYVDLNGDGQRQAGEPFDVSHTDGSFYVTGVPAGTYEVREELTPAQTAAGWTCSKPSGGCHKTIEMTAGGNSSNIVFGNWQPAQVSGTVWEDVNRNGFRDGSEDGLAGTTVYVDYDGDGVRDAGEPYATSGAGGAYTVTGVKPGTYAIRQEPRAGYTCTAPGGCAHSAVTLTSGGSVTERDFGDAPAGRVSGVKFEDVNANGVRDGGEPGLPGWTVYVDLNGNSSLDAGEPSAVTGPTGAYTIDDVRSGTHRVREVAQAGWTCSLPSPCSYTQAFAAGTDATGRDFGAWRAATAAGVVFHDTDANGTRGGGEPGLSGWTVYVDLDGDGVRDPAEPAANSAGDGSYAVTGVKPGTYAIRQETLPGWRCTAPAGCSFASVTFASGGGPSGRDFGDVQSTTVSGTKFRDDDRDGVRDAGEPGLAGWTVYVDLDGDGAITPGPEPGEPYAVTDANGAYTITEVLPNGVGNPYAVREVAQPTWTCSAPAGDCAHDGFVIASGTAPTGVDFGGYQQQSVSGASFEDLDGDGARDAGESGNAGATVWVDSVADNGLLDAGEPSAVTDADGLYTIEDAPSGSFKVREAPRAGWTCSLASNDANGCYRGYTLAGGENAAGVDFGSYRPASVSGTSFQDSDRDGAWDVDEGPAPGATIFVDGDGDGQLDAGEPSVVAGADGTYAIGGLRPRGAPYSIRSIPASGWTCTAPAGCQQSVTLSSGDAAEGRNFGSVPEASVSGTQFEDLNADGDRDAGEDGLAGWSVYVDYDNDGARDSGEPSAVTGPDGSYEIDQVMLGTFKVRVEDQPNWTCSSPASCVNAVTFVAGGDATGADFGAWMPGGISGTVFDDSNRDGSRAGESGLGGWVVFVDLDGNELRDPGEPSATTAGDGTYLIEGVTPGAHNVFDELQGEYVCTTPVPCGHSVDVTSRGNAGGTDFGHAVPGATIEGTVFEDLDGDGQPREGGEGPLAGRTVWLETVSDNGSLDPGEPAATTSDSGDFAFRNVNPGTWKLRLAGESGWACSYPAGGCDRSVTAAPGETAAGQDFGAWASPAIAGRTYEDLNADGDRDAGEPYTQGRTVTVDPGTPADPGDDLSTTSDAGGDYAFADLAPGTYTVRMDPPAGSTCSEPAGCTRTVTVGSGDTAGGNDFGDYRKVAISGASFEDLNADGDRDAGEPGVASRTIVLDPGTPGDPTDDVTTLTDGTGAYGFADLVPGVDYRVSQQNPAGWTCTTPSGCEYTVPTVSGDPPATGRDFGAYRTATVSGSTFEDLNADGDRDAGEPATSGRTVHLGGRSATTDSNGDYSFEDLDPGSYTVTVDEPSGWTCSAPAGCSHSVTVVSGGNAGGRDFGDYRKVGVAGTSYEDVDGDGSRDPGEPGNDGRTIKLDPGTPGDSGDDLTATTDPSGDYTFDDLLPGVTYRSYEPAVGGWTCSTAGGCEHSLTPESGDGTAGGNDFGSYRPASIAGTTYEDLNADGDRDAGEPATGGRTVHLGGRSATTDSNGDYSFDDLDPDDYTVTIDEPSGWTCSAPAGCAHSVTVGSDDAAGGNDFGTYRKVGVAGTSYEDVDGDGSRDPGEPGNDGRTVKLDPGTPGDPSDDVEATTDAGGDYSFGDLVPGVTYRVYEPAVGGWTCSTAGGCEHSVPTESGDGTISGNDFGSYRKATISGSTYEDLDADGDRDAGEPATGGRTVHLEPGGRTTTTDADGSYSFGDLDPGTYTVTVDEPSGWTCSAPAGCEHDVTVGSGGNAGGRDFGDYRKVGVAGTSYEDRDADGTRDAGEPGNGARTIELEPGDLTTTTDSNGNYSFDDLKPGTTYRVYEPSVSGWTCSTTGGCEHDVPTQSGDGTRGGNDFGSYRPASIAGTAYEDRRADGKRDPGDPDAAGREVYIDLDASGDLSAGDPTTTTNGDGEWSFDGLEPGTYSVRMVEPSSSWHCSDPAPDCEHTVTVASGEGSADHAFGDYREVAVTGVKFDDRDGDGRQDDGEPGLGNRNIYLDPGTPDDPSDDIETTTDGDGGFSFPGLKPGLSYRIYDPITDGWTCTTDCTYTVAPVSGDDPAAVEFGAYAYARLQLREVLHPDTDGGRFDLAIDGSVEKAAAGNGDATAVKQLLAGDHAVAQSAAAGTAATDYAEVLACRADGGAGAVVDSTGGNVSLAAGDDVVCTFTTTRGSSIDGAAFEDVDGDGAAREAGDPMVAGADVYADVDGDGRMDAGEPHGTTDGRGRYTIAGLPSGSHVVRRKARAGYDCTYPKGCASTVVLAAGEHRHDVDFGDHKPAPPIDCGTAGASADDCPDDPDEPQPPASGCSTRDVVTWVRGHKIDHVVFYLDGKRRKTVRRADERGRWSLRIKRRKLSPGHHAVRARVFFTTKRRPLTLRFRIRGCVNGHASRSIHTSPHLPSRCASRAFRAYVTGDTIRRVVFTLDGRRLKATQVADWKGRYWVGVDPAHLARGAHVLRAKLTFVKSSRRAPRELELRFRRCSS
ncbi:MAG TPA: SdrD B-like domain-containing protein [Thermoleophilaceae bacterium]|nr:SdrD B-like domain-containing protein [Thermoleophilaceae bacterium]